MRGDFRKRSAATWAVWGTAFVAVALLMAWKFQWFGGGDPAVVEQGSATEGENLVVNDGPPAGEEIPDPAVFGGQSEPGAGSATEVPIPQRFGSSALRKKYSTNAWDGPTDQPPGDENRSLNSQFPTASRQTNDSVPGRMNESRYRRDTEVTAAPFYGKGNAVKPAGFEAPQPGERYRLKSNRYVENRNPENPIQRAGYEAPNRLPESRRDIRPIGNETPKSDIADSRPPAMLIAKIDQFIQRDAILEAHKELSKIYWQKPEWRSTIMSRIEKTAEIIYFSPRRHFLKPYTVQPNEYLSTIAAKYDVPYQYLERLNGVKSNRIRAGQELKVIKGPFSVVVDLSDRELTMHHKGWFVARFKVGIGSDQRSPRGEFTVKKSDKHEKPEYTGQHNYRNYTIPGGHPDNPLGTHWIGIGNSFGIHGTNEPRSIGKAESKGCIRMLNADVAWVYDMLSPGAKIVIQE